MGTRNQDGTFDDRCLDKVEPGEPFFVLRSTDKLSPALVRLWAELANLHGCPLDKVTGALGIADAMDNWALANRSKFPD